MSFKINFSNKKIDKMKRSKHNEAWKRVKRVKDTLLSLIRNREKHEKWHVSCLQRAAVHVVVAIVNDERRAAVLSDAPPDLFAERETLAAADVGMGERCESTWGVIWGQKSRKREGEWWY